MNKLTERGATMENDIVFYSMSYVALRFAILAGFAFVFYGILRGKARPAAIAERYSPNDRRNQEI
jgi:hypothetical protein